MKGAPPAHASGAPLIAFCTGSAVATKPLRLPLSERHLASRLPEGEAQASKAEQHHAPGRRLWNARGERGL